MFTLNSRRMGRMVLAAVLCLCVTAGAWGQQAKYVFLFIGDGMGLSQRTAGELYRNAQAGQEGVLPQPKLAMNALPVMGLAMTYSRDAVVTDSAAAGTALACGRKTDNGAIAMDPKTQAPYLTLAELAHRKGMRVGIVSTDTIDGATPACFYAHQGGRGDYYDIAVQLPASGFEYFAGAAPIGEKSKDGDASPYDQARRAGYTLATTSEEFRALKSGAGKVWVNGGRVRFEIERPADAPTLADWTRKGIELLEGEPGFFMMVEGACVDKASHANDPAAAVRDVVALDEAVAAAVEFADKHPGQTLIVVTADHETGGMTLGSTGAAARTTFAALAAQKIFSGSFGQQVKKLREAGTPFEDGLATIEAAFGLRDLTPVEKEKLAAAYDASMADLPGKDRDEETYRRWGGGDPLTATCVHVVGLRAGIGYTSWGHTASPVPTSAAGVGSERFCGYYDNTEIPKRIATVMGLTEFVQAGEQAPAATGKFGATSIPAASQPAMKSLPASSVLPGSQPAVKTPASAPAMK